MRLPPDHTKEGRVLAALLSGQSYNRFQAERVLHDHCLHSTISTLQKKLGVKIARKMEVVPGYQGSPTHCCRYWLGRDERNRIKKALTTSDQTNGEDFLK